MGKGPSRTVGKDLVAGVLLGALAIYSVSQIRFDFPWRSRPLEGRARAVTIEPAPRGFNLVLQLEDRPGTLVYFCRDGRRAHCLERNSLRYFAERGAGATVEYMGVEQELVMLRSGDIKVLRYPIQQLKRVWLPVLGFVGGAFAAALLISRSMVTIMNSYQPKAV